MRPSVEPRCRTWHPTAPFAASSLLLFACGLGLAIGARPARAQDAALERARIQLQSGKVYFENGDYRRAIEQFQSADELKPAAAISYNIAQAYERWAAQISDPVERTQKLRAAAQNLRKYLERDPRASDAAEVRRRIAAIEDQLLTLIRIESEPAGAQVRIDEPRGASKGRTPLLVALPRGTHTLHLEAPFHRPASQTLEVKPAAGDSGPQVVRVELKLTGGRITLVSSLRGARVSVDGKEAGVTPLGAPLVMAPGRHLVRLEKEGQPELSRTVDLAEGESQVVVLEAGRGRHGALWTAGWTVGGVGAAVAVTGIVLGVQTLRKKSDFDACQRATPGAGPCLTLQDDGRKLQHITDALLWPGVALVATGAVLLILDWRGSRGERAAVAGRDGARGGVERGEGGGPSPSLAERLRQTQLGPLIGGGSYGLAAKLSY